MDSENDDEKLDPINKRALDKLVAWIFTKAKLANNRATKHYLECDTSTAAHLCCCNFRHLGLRITANGRLAFCFEDPEGFAAIESILYRTTVKAFCEKMKRAKKQESGE